MTIEPRSRRPCAPRGTSLPRRTRPRTRAGRRRGRGDRYARRARSLRRAAPATRARRRRPPAAIAAAKISRPTSGRGRRGRWRRATSRSRLRVSRRPRQPARACGRTGGAARCRRRRRSWDAAVPSRTRAPGPIQPRFTASAKKKTMRRGRHWTRDGPRMCRRDHTLERVEPALDPIQAVEDVAAHVCGLNSTTNSQSSAVAIPRSVSMRGGRPPLSRRAIADCVVPQSSAGLLLREAHLNPAGCDLLGDLREEPALIRVRKLMQSQARVVRGAGPAPRAAS
jgi:hypothetical protein